MIDNKIFVRCKFSHHYSQDGLSIYSSLEFLFYKTYRNSFFTFFNAFSPAMIPPPNNLSPS